MSSLKSPDNATASLGYPLPRVFHLQMRTWKAVVSPAILYLVIFISTAYQGWNLPGHRFYALGMVGMVWSAHLLLLAIRVPRIVVVSTDTLMVQYTLWQRLVPYAAISDVKLSKLTARLALPEDQVEIALTNGSSLALRNLREGVPLLFHVLRTAWENNHSLIAV